jgi:hypothetical protein
MGEPAKKVAFHKPTNAWVVVQPNAAGKWDIAETLDEDPSNWTGEAYELARQSEKASVALKEQLDWYQQNMLEEPSGPLDENGKTTATPTPMLGAANDNAQAAPANDNGTPAAQQMQTPVSADTSWGSLMKAAGDKLFSGEMLDNGERVTEAPAEGEPDDARTVGRGDMVAYRDDGTDFMRGLGQGVTLRMGDELSGNLEGALDYAFGDDMPRATGRGFDAPVMTASQRFDAVTNAAIERNRKDNKQSQERSPYRYGAGEVVGAGSVATLTAPVAAAGTPWAAMVAPNAVQGAALGYLTGYGGSEGDSRLSDATVGAGAGALGGAAGTAIGAGMGAMATRAGQGVDDAVNAVKESAPVRAVRDYAGNLADRSRAAATGAYGAQLKQLSKDEGFDFVDRDLGQAVERMFPPERGMLGLPKARTARDYAEVARPKQEELGRTIGNTLREMDTQGVSAPVIRDPINEERAVLDSLDDEIVKYSDPMRLGDDDAVMRKALTGMRDKTLRAIEPSVDRSLGVEMPRLSATQLATMKRSLESSGYATEATKGLPAGVQREANRVAATGPREALREAAKSKAKPGTYAEWDQANRDFPIAKMIAELSEGRAAQEQGNQIVSLPGAIATAAGGPAAAVPVAGWEMAKRYGADASANALRGVQRSLTPVAREAVDPAPAMSMAAERAAVPGSVWASLARGGQPAMAQEPPGPRVDIGEASITSASPVEIGEATITKRSPEAARGESVGHEAPRMVRDALRAYPQALGKYKQQLEQAWKEEDPTTLSSTIVELQRSDPGFRKVMQELQAQDAVNRSGGNR